MPNEQVNSTVGNVMQRIEVSEFEAFEWDEAKREATLAKSGLDFRIVASALFQPRLEESSRRGDEHRIKAICSSSGRVIVVIYTMRNDICRIISAWPADKNEQRKYRQILG